MQRRDDGPQGEAPLETDHDVDKYPEQGHQQRQAAVVGQFVAHLRSDEFHPPLFHAVVAAPLVQGVEDGGADLGAMALLARRHADQNVVGRAEVLHHGLSEATLLQGVTHLV